MPAVGDKQIQRILIQSVTAIINAWKAKDIFEAIKRFGYGSERLKQGKELHDKTYRLCKKQKRKYAAQFEAAGIYRQTLEKAKSKYITHREVARLALRGHPSLKKILALEGRSKRGLGEWMEEARQFYVNARANAEVMEKLAGFGLTDADLEQGLKLVDEVEKAAARHEMLKGEAVRATRERNQAFKEFMAWMKDFRKICRVALAGTPQKLKKLGM